MNDWNMPQWRPICCGRGWVLKSTHVPVGAVVLDCGTWQALLYNIVTCHNDFAIGDYPTLDQAQTAVERRWLDRNLITRGLDRIPRASTPAR